MVEFELMKQKLKLAAKQLRASEPDVIQRSKVKRRDIYIVLDNVLDTFNIGAIFRLADAIGAKCIYLCDGAETPPNPKISKSSVGCDKWVDWEYFPNAKSAILDLKSKVPKVKVVAIEQDKRSVDFRTIDYSEPIAFVVGHETDGCSSQTLSVCDQVAEIPMYGVNISLNVMVSLAIVLFRAI